ncbi:MAG: LicD family protein, partial [Actinomycetota bacterium]|nr:LicD family protein [Actinomycetota bacterium]
LYTPQKIHKKIDAIVERFDYDKCDLVRNYFGAWGEKEMVPKEYFGKGCVLPFEKISVVAPLNYDKYLKSLYGNYMMPPPKEKQISHHEKLVIDLNNSYILH